MAERGRASPLLIVVLLAGLAGCVGPARGPDPLVGPPAAPAPVPHTEAKPPSPGLFAVVDPRAARLDVRPPDAVLATHAEQVLIASVVDAAGRPLPGRRVEWSLDGPGAIVAVDEHGRLLESGRRIDDHSAVSFTEHFEDVVHRSGAADFTIGRGQSWCVVASTVEGQSHVTVVAPEVGAPNANRVVVTQHWTDADWAPPTPSAGRPGAQQFLSATVQRRGSREPMPGYSVRYRILDGPPAQFLPEQSGEAVVATSSAGVAPVVLAQPAPQLGRNRIGVELLGKDGAVVARGETYADWQGPDLALAATFLPTATVGQEAPLTLSVNNAGAVDSGPATVRVTVPDGCKTVRSDPPATPQGQDLVWTLPSVPARGRGTLQAVFQTDHAGPLTARASLTADDGRRDEKTAVCDVAPRPAPQLNVWPTGPETGLVGGSVVYQVRVQNPGTVPATNVVLKASLTGLEYEAGGDNVELRVGTLAAGESRTVALPVRPKKAGAASAQVTAVGDGGLAAQAERPLQVRDARLTLRLTGPQRGYVGRPTEWELEVRNVGETPLTQTTVSDPLPPEWTFTAATDGGRLQGREVVWNLGDLPPNGQKVLHLTTTTARTTPQATNTATATARVGADASAAEVRVSARADVSVLGLPAFKMTVEARDGPIEVGGRTAYRVVVSNTGSLPGERVQVTATIPSEMRMVTAYGPTTYQMDGARLTFTPLETLPPGQTVTYMVEVQAVKAGDARFRAELTTAALREPVVKEESTNVQ